MSNHLKQTSGALSDFAHPLAPHFWSMDEPYRTSVTLSRIIFR
jgi:hypothetical protein